MFQIAIQENKNEELIWNFFQHGRQVRKVMEIHKRAGVDSFYDLFLSNVPDEERMLFWYLRSYKRNVHC